MSDGKGPKGRSGTVLVYVAVVFTLAALGALGWAAKTDPNAAWFKVLTTLSVVAGPVGILWALLVFYWQWAGSERQQAELRADLSKLGGELTASVDELRTQVQTFGRLAEVADVLTGELKGQLEEIRTSRELAREAQLSLTDRLERQLRRRTGTIEELARALGVEPATIAGELRKLDSQGRATRDADTRVWTSSAPD